MKFYFSIESRSVSPTHLSTSTSDLNPVRFSVFSSEYSKGLSIIVHPSDFRFLFTAIVHNAKCVSIYRNIKRCVSLLAMLLRFNAHTHGYHGNTFETATRFRNLNRMKFDSRSDSILFH